MLFRFAALGCLALLTTACAAAPQPAAVRFEIRGLTTKQDETEYSTQFRHTATLVVLGDTTAAKAPYLVMLDVEHLSGGDPEASQRKHEMVWTEVQGGTGDIEIFAGSRMKAMSYSQGETWQPEKIRMTVVGYVPVTVVRGSQPVEN